MLALAGEFVKLGVVFERPIADHEILWQLLPGGPVTTRITQQYFTSFLACYHTDNKNIDVGMLRTPMCSVGDFVHEDISYL